MKEANRIRRALALGLSALLLLALLPILLVGACAHPGASDLAQSLLVHRAAVEGTSVLGALAATVQRNYLSWDGSFASIILAALQPGLLGEGAYILTPILLAGGLCLSTAALAHAFLRRWLNMDRWSWLCVSAGLSLVTILYQPSPRNAFLRWDTGAGCTMSFNLTLLLFTCLVRLRLEPKHPRLLFCGALVLAVFTGGGDPTTGIVTCTLLTGYALLCALRDRKRLPQVLPVWAVFLACFLISSLSPGSALSRSLIPGLDPLHALHMALLLTLPNTQWNLHLLLIALLVGAVPLLREIAGRTRFSFPLPGVVTGAAVLLLVLQYAQAMVVSGVDLSKSAMNSTFNPLPWLLLLTEGYWAGWFGHRWAAKLQTGSGGYVKAALLIGSIGLILSASGTAPATCLPPLLNGSARAFDSQVNSWVQVLSDPQADPAELTQLTVPPFLLYDYSLYDDPESYINTTYANYYGKTAVIAYPPEE